MRPAVIGLEYCWPNLTRACRRFAALGTIAGLVVAGSGAMAAEKIGRTAVARNIVQEIATAPANIQVGDDVFANENVRTGNESAAKFVFSDETNLALGATSAVKLDRFVYNTETNYIKAAVNFTAGAFRFTTGSSEKGAYQLKTSTATIGVRGTVFDVLVQRGETTITLVEGNIAVCPRKEYDGDPRRLSKVQLKKFHCVELTKPGDTAVISSRMARLRSTPFSFAATAGCQDGLCEPTRYADLATPVPGGGGGLMCYMKPENN